MSLPAIDITGLTESYGRYRGIEDVSLQVEEGKKCSSIGPNGPGKSTSIRVLLNLFFPTTGKAQIMGLDVVRDLKKIKYHNSVPSLGCKCLHAYGCAFRLIPSGHSEKRWP